MEEIRRNPFVVDWYSLDDTDNPRNVSPIVPLLPHAAHRFLYWCLLKKCFVTFNICLLTFGIYIGAAIYAPGIPDLT